MPLGRQAKILSPKQQRQILNQVETSRHPERDGVTVAQGGTSS